MSTRIFWLVILTFLLIGVVAAADLAKEIPLTLTKATDIQMSETKDKVVVSVTEDAVLNWTFDGLIQIWTPHVDYGGQTEASAKAAPSIKENEISTELSKDTTINYKIYPGKVKETLTLTKEPSRIWYDYDIKVVDVMETVTTLALNATEKKNSETNFIWNGSTGAAVFGDAGYETHTLPLWMAQDNPLSITYITDNKYVSFNDIPAKGGILIQAGNKNRVFYQKPFATDAKGKIFPMDFVLDKKAKTLEIKGDLTGAAYPIEVDPTAAIVSVDTTTISGRTIVTFTFDHFNGYPNTTILTSNATWTAQTNVTSIQYLVIGSGGGGGGYVGGGGGGGAVLQGNLTVTPGQNYSVSVGAGGGRGFTIGTSNNQHGLNGVASQFWTVLAPGGGGGGTGVNHYSLAGNRHGWNGSSGGGAAGYATLLNNIGYGTLGLGYDGGYNNVASNYGSGGGGGAGGAGFAGSSNNSGNGGGGVASSITGCSTYYGGGGGGGAGYLYGLSNGQGGSGSGGAGGNRSAIPYYYSHYYGYDGVTYGGGGGAGMDYWTSGGSPDYPNSYTIGGFGADGVVIISYGNTTGTSPVSANFTGSPTSINATEIVQFNDTSTGDSINLWTWAFGDGSFFSTSNPLLKNTSNQYFTAGNYTVQLQVANVSSNDTMTKTDYIKVNTSLKGNITSNVTVGKAPLPVEFYGGYSNGVPISWYWDFGNGVFATSRNPVYTYPSSGIFYVSLMVNSSTTGDIVSGYKIDLFPFILVDFNATPTTINIGETVNFTSLSLGGITGWNWSFGDGALSTVENPSHMYNTAGLYAITLNVTNGSAYNSTTKLNYINVLAGIPLTDFQSLLWDPLTNTYPYVSGGVREANLTYMQYAYINPIYGATLNNFLFGYFSYGANITSVNWSFGDGNYSELAQPNHSYPNEGLYSVCLTVYAGATSNFTVKPDYINIRQPIIPNFTYTVIDPNATQNIVVIFNGSYMGAVPTSWNWSFGDGQVGSGQNISHTYDVGRVYYVMLNVSNTNTSATVTHPLYLLEGTPLPTKYETNHIVRFMCKDWMGAPIANMNVSAVGVETTLGSIDWIFALFGINLGNTNIIATMMNGSTGNDGAITFIMMPTEKYSLTYTCTTRNIQETRYYYPKEDVYEEIFWTQEQTTGDFLSYGLFNSTNGTFMDLGIVYEDTAMSTNSLTFFVQNESHSTLYTTTVVPSNATTFLSYPVNTSIDGLYYWGFSANSTQAALPINLTNSFRVSGNPQARLWDLHIGTGADVDTIYNWIAVILISLMAYTSSRLTLKFGVVIIPMMAMFFKFIGWLQTSWLLISIAVTLGIFIYLRFAEEESGL